MKKHFSSFCILLFVFSSVFAQTSGGPDNFGYIWTNSNDPKGPSFNWIDITTTGTEITGFADDNSVGFFSMG